MIDIGRRLGGGSFGHVYYSRNKKTGHEYALKVEKESTKRTQIFNEFRILHLFHGATGFPRVYFELQVGNQNAFTMELLGNSIQNLFKTCGNKFSLKTVLMLADQMIKRLEYMHDKGIIHRDVKPDNFVMSKRHEGTVCAVDFGISRSYIDRKTGEHIKFNDERKFCGTGKFSSINSHMGFELTRRDDMESLAYTLIYLLKGSLPWENVKPPQSDPFQSWNVMDDLVKMKLATWNTKLCEGIPVEFKIFLEEVRKLDFDERPDYSRYRNMFKSLFISSGFVYDSVYDWSSIVGEEACKSKLPPIQGKPKPLPNHSSSRNSASFGPRGTKRMLSLKKNLTNLRIH